MLEARMNWSILTRAHPFHTTYDALGRMIERIPPSSVSYSTKYTHDGQNVIYEQNTNGTTITYANGPGIDNKLRQKSGSTGNYTTSYFLADHLGSTVALLDTRRPAP